MRQSERERDTAQTLEQ